MTVRDVSKLFPKLVDTFEADRFSKTLATILDWAGKDPRLLTVPRKGHSRGFWNTVAMASLTVDDTVLSSLWRLSIIESGLVQAERAGKHKKFRASLAQDEAGFDQAIAELFCIGGLGPQFAGVIDLERAGSKKGKNYDIHLEGGGDVVQADVKWRTESPVGDAPPNLLTDFGNLLANDVTCTVYLTLRSNLASESERIRAACMIVDAIRVEQSTLLGPAIAHDNIASLPESLRTEALHLDYEREPFHKVELGGVDALYIPSERIFKVADRFVGSIECYDSGATVVVVPKAETRPVFAYQPQGALKYDYTHPESWGIADLLGAVHHQLPAAGINVVCLGLGDRYAFEDAELALFGEPDLLGTRTGGLFANATSTALSAVLAFSLTPFGMDGTSADASVRLFSNASAAVQLRETLGTKLVNALRYHGAAMVNEARRLK